MNPDNDLTNYHPHTEEEETPARVPDVNEDVLPYLSSMPDNPCYCAGAYPPQTPRASGLYRSARDSRVWRPPSPYVPPSGEASGGDGRRILRSATQGLNLSRGLPQLSQPQVGSEICDEGGELYIEHGSDGGVEDDMDASESPCKRRKTKRGYNDLGDEGKFRLLQSFDKAFKRINAQHDTWVQQNPWIFQ